MSNLSDQQKADLAAALAPKAPEGSGAAGAQGGGDGGGKRKDKMEDGEKEEEQPGSDAADPNHPQFAAGVAAERARMAGVFASEHYEGREVLANEMLGTSMSADEITRVLGKTPKGSAASEDILAAIRAGNPDLGTGAAGTGDGATRGNAQALWDNAIAANNPSSNKKDR